MPKTKMMRYSLIFFLLLPLITFAQTDEIKKYKIIKGDTLWDISERDLEDPFLWPEIWKENSWIVNPDLIYPNQIIKIPLYLIKKEIPGEEVTATAETIPPEETPAFEDQAAEEQAALPPEAAKEEAKKESVQAIKSSLINKNILMSSGYIADTIPDAGRVNDLSAKQLVSGSDDIIYLDTNNPTEVGDKFYVINSSKSIKHPITREKMGYVITIKGIVEVLKVNNKETIAKITKSFREINAGDRLDSYYDIEPSLTEGNFRTPDIDGTIVATSNNVALQSMLDIIYIDKGCKDGIEIGDIFKILEMDTHSTMNGVIQVINCKDHTATAIIKSSIAPISAGNMFTGLTKK
ncbi:hypothetical protein ASZ90_005974 [hydrocarbon metagenome]|uniref:LysM domain-containing protein n=1 Tax=hydrocarbon metagenome TaxID=938273 RepID=A0A0W8FU62_9ZZZZ